MKRKKIEAKKGSVKQKAVILYCQGIIKKIYANDVNRKDS
jgi:hypothetical protein